jgi:hypothetical protein
MQKFIGLECGGWDLNPRIPSKLAPQANAFDLSGQPPQMFALYFAQVLYLFNYYFFMLFS